MATQKKTVHEKVEEVPENGILVGRFQVDNLHEAHYKLVQTVIDTHPNVYVFLGAAPIKYTIKNPLPIDARRQMFQSAFPSDKYPNLNIHYIPDEKDNDSWSKSLDKQIANLIGVNQKAVLYGGRDSFINYYSGKYPTKELLMDIFVSGSEIRKNVSAKTLATADFRTGIMNAVANQYINAIPTVDVAILNADETKVLLARKPNEKQYRFVGGFVEPGETWEHAAHREATEETKLDELADFEYIGSYVIDDWRYRNEAAKITTTFFLCKYGWGRPEASDDICELRWADVGSLFCSKDEKVPDDPTDGWIEIVPEHLPLMKAFQQKMVTRRDAKYANRNIKESLRELHFCKPFDIGVGETLGKKAEWLARYANVDISLEYGNKDVVVYSGDAGVQYPIGASVSDVLHALAAQTEHKLIIADHKVYFVSGVAPKNAKNSKMKIEKGDVK